MWCDVSKTGSPKEASARLGSLPEDRMRSYLEEHGMAETAKGDLLSRGALPNLSGMDLSVGKFGSSMKEMLVAREVFRLALEEVLGRKDDLSWAWATGHAPGIYERIHRVRHGILPIGCRPSERPELAEMLPATQEIDAATCRSLMGDWPFGEEHQWPRDDFDAVARRREVGEDLRQPDAIRAEAARRMWETEEERMLPSKARMEKYSQEHTRLEELKDDMRSTILMLMEDETCRQLAEEGMLPWGKDERVMASLVSAGFTEEKAKDLGQRSKRDYGKGTDMLLDAMEAYIDRMDMIAWECASGKTPSGLDQEHKAEHGMFPVEERSREKKMDMDFGEAEDVGAPSPARRERGSRAVESSGMEP